MILTSCQTNFSTILSHRGVPEGLEEEAAHEHSHSPAHSQPTTQAAGQGKGLLVPRAAAFILGTPGIWKEGKWVYWALGYVLGFPQDLAGKVEFWSSRNSLQCSVMGLIRHKASVDTPPLVESEKLGA